MLSNLALLVAGAALTAIGALITSAIGRRSGGKQTQRDRREEQTRNALQASLGLLQDLYDAQARENVPDDLLQAAIAGLRRNAVLVHQPELRDRLQVARAALEWPEPIYDHMGSGLHYLIRYLYDEISAAAGSYLRLEPIPPETFQFVGVREALQVAYASEGHC